MFLFFLNFYYSKSKFRSFDQLKSFFWRLHRLRLQVLFAALMRAFRTPSGRGDLCEIQNFIRKLKNYAETREILRMFVFLKKVNVFRSEIYVQQDYKSS